MTGVTVVINVYDEPTSFVAEAIASVRAQTHKVDEILLIEDGGPGDYAALLAQNPDIRAIRQANGGLAAARNTGLEAASGEFILFLDGDDRLLPQAVAANLERLRARPDALLSYGAWRFIDRAGCAGPPLEMPPIGDDAYATLLRGNCIGMHATVLYRVAALRAAGGFDSSYRRCEDYELYLRLARAGTIVHGAEVVAEYRQHGTNMSSDHATMLASIHRVLDAQTPAIGDSAPWSAAREQGRANWNAHYARQQYLDVLRMLTGRAPARRTLAGLRRMFGMMPGTMVKVAPMELIERLRTAVRMGRSNPAGTARLALDRLRRNLRGDDTVDFGDLRRTTPISRWFGFDRGRPVDRLYIEDFLARHSGDIQGRVLEVGDNAYTLRFGGERVIQSEVLHVDPEAPGVTYVADLTDGAGIPDDAFDCVILTQTLHLIYDFHAAVRTLRRILKPGGVLLLTVPGVSSVDQGEWGGTWYWSFTAAAIGRMFEDVFRREDIDVGCHGNVLVATAFLYGLADHELGAKDYAVVDPHYPVIVTARVRKG